MHNTRVRDSKAKEKVLKLVETAGTDTKRQKIITQQWVGDRKLLRGKENKLGSTGSVDRCGGHRQLGW